MIHTGERVKSKGEAREIWADWSHPRSPKNSQFTSLLQLLVTNRTGRAVYGFESFMFFDWVVIAAMSSF